MSSVRNLVALVVASAAVILLAVSFTARAEAKVNPWVGNSRILMTDHEAKRMARTVFQNKWWQEWSWRYGQVFDCERKSRRKGRCRFAGFGFGDVIIAGKFNFIINHKRVTKGGRRQWKSTWYYGAEIWRFDEYCLDIGGKNCIRKVHDVRRRKGPDPF